MKLTFFAVLALVFLAAEAPKSQESKKKTCLHPKDTKRCIPFQTLQTINEDSIRTVKRTITGIFQCNKRLENIEDEHEIDEILANDLFFNVYVKGKKVNTVPGNEFLRTASIYARNECTILLMGGFMTDCNISADKVAETDDWRTNFVKNVLVHRPECTVIVVNWGHMCRFACREIKHRTRELVYKYIGLDNAGPWIQNNDLKKFYDTGEFDLDPNVAEHTVAVYTDPHYFGWKDFNAAKVNILVNPHSFRQPGGGNDHVYNHIFATALTTAMASNVTCPGYKQERSSRSNNRRLTYDLNYIYEDREDGTYNLHLTQCYPYCCEPPTH